MLSSIGRRVPHGRKLCHSPVSFLVFHLHFFLVKVVEPSLKRAMPRAPLQTPANMLFSLSEASHFFQPKGQIMVCPVVERITSDGLFCTLESLFTVFTVKIKKMQFQPQFCAFRRCTVVIAELARKGHCVCPPKWFEQFRRVALAILTIHVPQDFEVRLKRLNQECDFLPNLIRRDVPHQTLD